jgi:23S rRNA (pseudouridine1915-N3)-methyltransferase
LSGPSSIACVTDPVTGEPAEVFFQVADVSVERRIPDRSYVSLLHRDGREMESEAFARWLEDRRMDGRDLCFVIGGPYGLELPHVEHRLSFGKLTLPYQLARVVLLEQLYRAFTILRGEPYSH